MNGKVVLGFGCERGIHGEAVREGIDSFLEQRGREVDELVRVATLDVKRDEEGLIGAAGEMNCELIFYTVEQLTAMGTPPNPNPVVKRCVGVEGVCEPAALRASGAHRLTVEKTVIQPGQKKMTLAMATAKPGTIPDPDSPSKTDGEHPEERFRL